MPKCQIFCYIKYAIYYIYEPFLQISAIFIVKALEVIHFRCVNSAVRFLFFGGKRNENSERNVGIKLPLSPSFLGIKGGFNF